MEILEDALEVLASRSHWTRRGFVMTSLITGFALSVQPVSAETIHTDATGLDAGEVKVPVADGSIPAYRAMPDAGGPFPTVLVVQEIFGVHEHIKDICRRFAKLGYYAIAPELYARQGNPAEISDIKELVAKIVSKVPDAQVMSDLDASEAYAKSTGKADTEKLAITGFCWGGRITWLYAAHNPDLKAAVAWYGPIDRPRTTLQPKYPIDLATDLKCPCSASWRGRSEHPRRYPRAHGGGVQGRRQDVRLCRLPGCAARLQRRLPAELPPRSRHGRLGQNACLVQGPRRRLTRGSGRLYAGRAPSP